MDLSHIKNFIRRRAVLYGGVLCGVIFVLGLFLFLNHEQKEKKREKLFYTSLITKSEHEHVMAEFSKLMDQYFRGEIGIKARDDRLERLIASSNPKGDVEKAKHLRADIRLFSPLILAEYVMPMVLKKAYGHQVSVEEKKKLGGLDLGGLDVETYLKQQVRGIDPYIRKMKQYDFIYDAREGWDLGCEITPSKIRNDAGLYQAMAMLISPDVTRALADENRKEPVQVGNKIYLPPGKVGGACKRK